jgi:hypothetical protein
MATSIKHVQMAEEEGRQAKQLSSLDQIELPSNDFDDNFPEEPTEQVHNIIFKLVKKRKGRFYLDNSCDGVMNPKTKQPDMIWLLRGAQSIWGSDIENLLKDKTRYEKSRVGMDIVFVNGVCRVSSTDTLRLDFLRRHKKNVGKRRVGSLPGDYYEYDPVQEQRERHQRQMIKIELMFKARDMPIDQVRKLASYLGIALYDEQLGTPKTDEGIRTELIMKADNDPVTFQKYMNSKEIEVSWLVRKALSDSRIDTGDGKGNITWANGKGFITRMPSTRKPLEYLTELALTNSPEGRKFKEQLEQLGT